jgi:hypothetical protein
MMSCRVSGSPAFSELPVPVVSTYRLWSPGASR